jgi:hypothetical protein
LGKCLQGKVEGIYEIVNGDDDVYKQTHLPCKWDMKILLALDVNFKTEIKVSKSW